MDNLYNKFRFARKDLFRLYDEAKLGFVFYQVSFFLKIYDYGTFSSFDLADSVNAAAESRGLATPVDLALIKQVMYFFCGEYGYDSSLGHHFDAVRDIIREICMIHMINGAKFTDPLSRMIIDEFNYGEGSITVGDVIFKLRNTPRFMFLSNDLIDHVVYAVYDYFTGSDDMDS